MNKLILQALAYSDNGGTDTSDATAVAADILNGKTAYAKGEKITGSIQTKSAQTYTPSTSDQTIASGQYLEGAQTISGDANLIASNIKKDVSIFGVTGDYEAGGGTDVSDTTAIASDVLSGKDFYLANGTKTSGTIQSLGAQTITPTTSDQTIAAGKYLSGAQTISGDVNLIASNIKDGTTIFGVTGTYSGGGGSASRPIAAAPKDVNFYDWDGTLMYAYTRSEFLALNALPDYPARGDTTFYQWNWPTLSAAKKQVDEMYELNIGAECYANDIDGACWIDIELTSVNTPVRLVYFTMPTWDTPTIGIDWGDNSTGTDNTGQIDHTYTNAGVYRIRVWNTSTLSENQYVDLGFYISPDSAGKYGSALSVRGIYAGADVNPHYAEAFATSVSDGVSINKACRRSFGTNGITIGQFDCKEILIIPNCPVMGIQVANTPLIGNPNGNGYMVQRQIVICTPEVGLSGTQFTYNNNSVGLMFGYSSYWTISGTISIPYNTQAVTANSGILGGIRDPISKRRIKVIVPVYNNNGTWICPVLENSGRLVTNNTTGQYNTNFDFYLYHKPTTISDISTTAFGKANNGARIFVPANTKSEFVAAGSGWAGYQNDIYELS